MVVSELIKREMMNDDNMVTEELNAINVAIQYRACTQHISTRMVQRGAQGSVHPHVGSVKLDGVRFLPLQHAVGQAKSRGLFLQMNEANSTDTDVSSLQPQKLAKQTNTNTVGVDQTRCDVIFFRLADGLTKVRSTCLGVARVAREGHCYWSFNRCS
jgi:hypothetical protein